MTVSTVSSVGSQSSTTSTGASQTTTAAATNQLNYNDFLSLLISELKHQDPTQPMDATTMVSQLATVSEVGQSVQTNTTLSSMLTTTALTQAENLIGQTITSADGRTTGQVASVTIGSSGQVATLTDGSTVTLGNNVVIQ